MNGFCTNCGRPVPEGAAFCTGCGQRVGAVPAAAAANPAPAPVAKSSPILIIVAVIVGLFLLAGALGAFALYRSARHIHRAATANRAKILASIASAAKQAAGAAQARDADASSAAEPGSPAVSGTAKDACSLLSADELSKITGTQFVNTESSSNGEDETSCSYTPGPGVMYPVKLTVTFRNGRVAMQALQGAAPKLVPGSETGSDLGDASFFLPMDVSLYTLKGDSLVALGFGLGNYTKEQKKAVAAKVLSRL